jgi:hypothetical protein
LVSFIVDKTILYYSNLMSIDSSPESSHEQRTDAVAPVGSTRVESRNSPVPGPIVPDEAEVDSTSQTTHHEEIQWMRVMHARMIMIHMTRLNSAAPRRYQPLGIRRADVLTLDVTSLYPEFQRSHPEIDQICVVLLNGLCQTPLGSSKSRLDDLEF